VLWSRSCFLISDFFLGGGEGLIFLRTSIVPCVRYMIPPKYYIFLPFNLSISGKWDPGLSGSGATLLVGRSRDRFPVVSLVFAVTYSFSPYHGPGVDSAPSENEYQDHFLGVKAAGAWGWRPHHLHVPNTIEIWEPKRSGTLWTTPGLLRVCLTLYLGNEYKWWSYLLCSFLSDFLSLSPSKVETLPSAIHSQTLKSFELL